MNNIQSLRIYRKPVTSLLIALAMMLASGVAWVEARATVFTDNVRVPFETIVFVPCAAGGIGEEVYLSGSLHLLFRTTFDNRGGFHSKFHAQPQGLSGIGLTTGDKYQGTGVTQDNFNGRVGSTYTFVNNFWIIGQGSGNNLQIHENLHITVNANGEVTVFVDNFRVECKPDSSYP
jgi:hypothetical protein